MAEKKYFILWDDGSVSEHQTKDAVLEDLIGITDPDDVTVIYGKKISVIVKKTIMLGEE